MLPLPNLDDRTFEQLVREARDLIPGIFAEWTDENSHDPGMTLLEMLAWHIEMQQYQLDRITHRHEYKFLKLLGVMPLDRTAAATSVSFSGTGVPVHVPLGTLLRVGDLPFETVRPVVVLPDGKRTAHIQTASGTLDLPDDFATGSVPFYPFGSGAEPGVRMEIVFEYPLPHALPLSIWIELTNPQPNKRIPARYSSFVPSATLEWSYWKQDIHEGAGDWVPVKLERDETYALHQNGPILFEIPEDAGLVNRLSVQWVGGVYDDPPQIRRMIWNEVFVEQGQTLCISQLFDGPAVHPDGTGKDALVREPYELEHALFRTGEVSVQFKRDDGGWNDVSGEAYSLTERDGKAFLTFHSQTRLPFGPSSIRAIAVAPEWSKPIYCGQGTGISEQTCPLLMQPILPGRCRLQVGWIPDGEETIVWYDWERVHDFDQSAPESLHYIIDEEEGVFRFSDGVHGAVPPAAPFPNIRVIDYRIGGGEEGNVKAGAIRELAMDPPLKVTHLYPAYGGAEPETMREAMQRAKMQVLDPKCGITAEDMERIVMDIPGLRIARVKAIPGYRPAMHHDPVERDLGHLSVVVVPYSRRKNPLPSAGMLQTIRKHLEPYRLLTTKLHVIPPAYIQVTIGAVVVVDPRYEGREHEARACLNQWLQPYGDQAVQEGWAFGRSIKKNDLYDVIHQLPGVQYIQDLWIMAEGKDVHREEGGDVRIPPNGLAVSGAHQIEFIPSNR